MSPHIAQTTFDISITCTISLNCSFMVFAVNCEMTHDQDDELSLLVVVGALAFFGICLLECVAKLIAYQLKYFIGEEGILNWLELSCCMVDLPATF